MTYENIKSIILTILVITSGLLTWNLWTYQPNYEVMENSKTVKEVSLSEQKDVKKIVKPDRVFYHQKGKHIGTVDPAEIDKVTKEISHWNLGGFKNISTEVSNVPTFILEKQGTEIVFPDTIPMKIYKNILNMQGSIPNIKFDHIFINVGDSSEENGYVYFISYEQNQVFQSRVASSFISNFKKNYYQTAFTNHKYLQYIPMPVSDKRTLMVSDENTTVPRYTYLIDEIQPEKFRDALFNNPSNVQRGDLANGEEYTDGSTLLKINHDTNTIFYINLAEENEKTSISNDLLQQSIDFVNNHGGWTDKYRYVGMDESGQYVNFRLYDELGYPIFNDNGMSEIVQIWGKNEIYQYIRNYFSLHLRTESNDVSLISGKTALDSLKKSDEFNEEFLQDLVIGYKMTKDPEDPLVHLEPAWYYKYNDQWWIVPTDELGRLKNGLE